MLNLPNYQLHEKIYESLNTSIYRAKRKQDTLPVILKVLKQDYPSSAELSRYQQEYKIINDLKLDGVIKVYAIEKYQNTLFLVLEDIGAKSLKQLLLNSPVTINEFIPLAIQIADSLANLHTENLIHKDINPSNIVINPLTKQIKIIDFGIASQIKQENTSLINPAKIEGTLAYSSPEQSGRINRSLDYRSDLYSLGITFYELLTGQLPFSSTDAMELVHCHIAKRIAAVYSVNSDVPEIISNIVMKLLEKNSEDRYQSAYGLKADLELCQQQLIKRNSIENFPIAKNDYSGRLQIPQKLYGRNSEIQRLLNAFQRASLGKAEIMLVAGYSGVGKTSLVHEVHKPMTQQRGYFATGKFDQFQQNRPYYAITQAFNQFCRYLIMEDSDILAKWQSRIIRAVGDNGQIIIDVIPDLEMIIGKQKEVAKVGPTEAQNRFNLFFLDFVKVLCTKENPFILFIDDLQWVDSASLALLKSIMLDEKIQHLLIIGAYRDNEVDSTHPFIMMLEELQHSNAIINQIELANLQVNDINHLLSDSLKCKVKKIQALADLTYQKTSGNAFFTHQFLHNLYDEKLINFDIGKKQWQWDLKQIVAKNVTANVVDLMASKINKLAVETSLVLQNAACIGNQFDLSILAIITQKNKAETLKLLNSAIIEGLILSFDVNTQFKFLHDRVQQAAYSLIDAKQKKSVHLKIGNLLLENATDKSLDENIFDIVCQFNHSIDLLSEDNERQKIAQLNLQAGLKAKMATAYEAAANYFATGRSCLGEESWQSHYDLTFELYKQNGECEYLLIHLQQSEELFSIAIENARTNIEKAEIYTMQMKHSMAFSKLDQAFERGITALALCGFNFPLGEKMNSAIEVESQQVEKRLADRKISALLNVPQMLDETKILAMRVLSNIALSCYLSGKTKAYTLSTLMSTHLSLKYGQLELSAYIYGWYGLLLSAQGQLKKSYEFGRLALQLSEKYPNSVEKTQTHNLVGTFLIPLNQHIKYSTPVLMNAYQTGFETGDVLPATFCYGNLTMLMFAAGNPLATVSIHLKKIINISYKNKVYSSGDIATGYQQLIQLLKTGDKIYSLTDDSFETEQFQRIKTTNSISFINHLRLQKAFWFEEYTNILEIAKEAELTLAYIPGYFLAYEHCFIYSLVLSALYTEASTKQRLDYLQQIEDCEKKIKLLSESSPENFLHRYLLIQAEKSRINGNDLQAMRLYDEAIVSAKAGDFIQNAALANELAARFWINNEKDNFADLYLKEAYYLYGQWGAHAKVARLETKYPQLITPSTTLRYPMSTTGTIMSPGSTQMHSSSLMDLTSVIKASQTLSGEIILSKLLASMMSIVVENAGAESGLLLLPKQKSWFIEAQGQVENDQVEVLQSIAIEDSELISANLVHYVARTSETIVLSDACKEGRFTQDRHIIKHQCKSILVMPLLNQNKLIGILYLENRLTEAAFTAQRLEVLTLLSSQITISIENSLLYNNLEKQKDILDYKAHYDELTGLPNRELFLDRLSQSIKIAQRTKKIIAVLFIDLDRFKEINDSFDHQFGDLVLKKISQRLQKCMRKTDTLSRLGGDEFTVIIDALHDNNEVVDIIQHMIEKMNKPIHIDNHQLYSTFSIGISLYPDDGKKADVLLKNADAAMYKAKDNGRNTYCFYTQEMTNKALERIVMETNLHQALENEDFIIYYQPQVDGENGKLLGMEALIRWQHKTMGMISPAKFIPLAEETGLIVPLDQWTMRTAMQQIVIWYQQGLNPGRLALNLAMKQLQSKDFIGMLAGMLKATGCKPQWIALEVTEGQIMTNPDKAITILDQVSNMGVELAVDDFGTGYSSLSYLKRLPIDKLKIDQSFVRNLPNDEDDIAIAKSIIALSKNLNLKVIAEGVETQGQKEFLVENGCRAIQGYLYSKPIPADEMERYIQH